MTNDRSKNPKSSHSTKVTLIKINKIDKNFHFNNPFYKEHYNFFKMLNFRLLKKNRFNPLTQQQATSANIALTSRFPSNQPTLKTLSRFQLGAYVHSSRGARVSKSSNAQAHAQRGMRQLITMTDTWRYTCNLGESLVYVLDRVANERNARHLRPPRFLLVVSSTRKDTASERINIVPTLLLFNAFRIALLSRREQRKRRELYKTVCTIRFEEKSETLCYLLRDFESLIR